MHLVERFAAFAEASRRAPLPAEVVHHAKRAVIDWYAALLPGAVATAVSMPIAETMLCVNSPGAHVSDPSELPYRHLRAGIRLRPMGPVRE